MNVELIKVHGSGNDFYLLDQQKLVEPLTDEQMKQLAVNICRRQNGLYEGADGLLVVDHSNHPGVMGRMRVINADGSEASMCGNGLRTVARYLSEANGETAFRVETMYADLKVQRAKALAAKVATYQVEISPVSFEAEALGMHVNGGATTLIDSLIPDLSTSIKFSAVAVPNPHLIAFVDEATLQGPELGRIARYLNDGQNPIFPDGVNVSFVQVLGKNSIFVRTYERGVGYTNACGTAMSASSLMYVLLHQADADFHQKISVRNPGGMVQTIVHQDADDAYWIELIGNATFVKYVNLPLSAALNDDFAGATVTMTDEQPAYENFVKQLATV